MSNFLGLDFFNLDYLCLFKSCWLLIISTVGFHWYRFVELLVNCMRGLFHSCLSTVWPCTKSQHPGARLMIMFRKELFLHIFWIVKTRPERRYIIHAVLKDNFGSWFSFTLLEVMWLFYIFRFSATPLSKRGRRRLGSGMFLYLRWDCIQYFNLLPIPILQFAFPLGRKRAGEAGGDLPLWVITSMFDFSFPQVRPVAEDEMFKVVRTGKRKSKYYIYCFWYYEISVTWLKYVICYIQLLNYMIAIYFSYAYHAPLSFFVFSP